MYSFRYNIIGNSKNFEVFVLYKLLSQQYGWDCHWEYLCYNTQYNI